MATWNNQIGITNWANRTNNNTITSIQLISSINGLGSIGYISSSQFQSTNSVFISLFSTLFGSTITGDTDLWSEYPAISDINVDNNSIDNVNNISVDFINPNSNRSVAIPGNGLQVDYLTTYQNHYIEVDSDFDVLGNFSADSIYAYSAGAVYFNNDINMNGNNIDNANFIFSSNASINLLSNNHISSGSINVSTISTNFLSLSSIGGIYGNYLSTALANLSNASTNTDNISNWANYPAVNDVNLSNHNMNNGNTITSSNLYATNGTTTQSLYVGNGGQIWAGNAQFNKIDYGNYHNFTMDANVTVANNTTLSCPNYNGYYSNYYLGVNSVDFTGFFTNAAVTNAQLKLNTVQSAWTLGIVPFGNAELSVNDYQFTFIADTYNFRGQTYFGTKGAYPAFVRMNSDSTTLLPNTSALLEISATSAFGVGTILGTSRITTTCGRNQMLSGFTNQIYAGYLSVLAPFTFANICSIDQTANFGPLGGGVTVIATNGGGAELGAVGLGARTDLVANNWITSNQSGVVATSEMNVFCTDIIYLYTEGDTYLGWGNGSNARYGSNREQRTHLSNLFDISPTGNGVTNWYGNLDMCNNSIYNVKFNLSTASFSTITTGHLEVFNNIYQSNDRPSIPSVDPYYPYINTNAIEMLNSFSSIQSYISTTYYPMTQTITDTPHNIYASDFGYTFYSGYTTTDTLVNIQSGNGELRFYNTGTTSMHFNFYFSPPTTPVILPGASLRIIVSNSNSYVADAIPLAASTIVSTVSINKTNFYQDMYDTILSVDISGYNLTSNYKQKGNFYLNTSTITFGRSNTGFEIIGYPNDPPNYPIKFVLPTQFDSNVIIQSLNTNSISTNLISTGIIQANTGIFNTISTNTISSVCLFVSSIQVNNISAGNIIGGGGITQSNLTSSLIGLGTLGYVSSSQLISTVKGLGTTGYISSTQLTSTVRGLGDIYVSTPSLISTITGWSGIPANTNVNMGNHNISNVQVLYADVINPNTFSIVNFPTGGIGVQNIYAEPVGEVIYMKDSVQFQSNVIFGGYIDLSYNDISGVNNIYFTEAIGDEVFINVIKPNFFDYVKVEGRLDLCNYNISNVNTLFYNEISGNQVIANSLTLIDTVDGYTTTFSNYEYGAIFDTNSSQFSFTNSGGTESAVIQVEYAGIGGGYLYIDNTGAFHLSNNVANAVIIDTTLNADYIIANLNPLVQFTKNSIDMNNNSISNINMLEFNDADNIDYGTIILSNGYFSYISVLSPSTYIPIASDWWNFGANGNVNLNYNSINNISNISTDFISANSNITITFNNALDLAYNDINNVDNFSVNYISAYTAGAVYFDNDVTMNGNNIDNVNNINLNLISFSGGSIINETSIGGYNYLQLSNQTVIQSNLIIANGIENPKLYFNSGKTGYIDYYSDFTLSDNLDLSNNTIYNVNAISTLSISTGTIYTSSLTVSTINNINFPLIQFGIATVDTIVTLSNNYSNSNYSVLLTYSSGAYGVIPVYGSNIDTSNFYIGGSIGYQCSWMTIGF